MKIGSNGSPATGWLRRPRNSRRGSDEPLVDGKTLRQRRDVYAKLVERLDTADRGLLYGTLSARGELLFDQAEHAVGVIRAVMVDRETASPRWLVVEHGYTSSLSAVPALGLDNDGRGYRTPVGAKRIHGGPEIDLSNWSAATERRLRDYYGGDSPPGIADEHERRAACSRAFQDPDFLDQIGWLPAPRTRSAAPGSRPSPGG
jgi:hypothetical protein